MRKANKTLSWNAEGMKPLARLRNRRENNIKMDAREIGYEGVDWIQLAQNSVN